MYTLVETEQQGKVAVATADIRAGTVLFEEKPMLTVTVPSLQGGRTPSSIFGLTLNPIEMYEQYCTLDDEKKARFLDLARPFENPLVPSMIAPFKGTEEWRSKIDLLTKICNVFAQNLCGTVDNVAGLFEQTSRLPHSCCSNCIRCSEGDLMMCRATRNISAGELLTISDLGNLIYEPTHLRRACFMAASGFTCHCPRCDAVGDDTRQFNCFDAHCQGAHLVCQPINRDPLPHGCVITDVEYVDPHLLPCTVCQRPPPAMYQAAMLQLEARLPIEIDRIRQQVPLASGVQLLSLFEETFDLLLPPRHALNLAVADVRSDIVLRLTDHSKLAPELLERYTTSNIHCARLVEALLPGVATPRAGHLWSVAIVRGDGQLVKEAVMKSLRTTLIMCDRENRESWCSGRDVPVQHWHRGNLVHTIGISPNTDVCAFCGESPARAALKRSRCGACKKVMYCSRSCQKAHWPIHKAVCGHDLERMELVYVGSAQAHL
jgi:hypothetical protein